MATHLLSALAVLVALAPGTPSRAHAPAQATPRGSQAVRLYLIALNDDGRSGKRVGCGDSVVPVTVLLPRTRAPLRAALERLLALRSTRYPGTRLYNALHRSRLRIARLNLTDGRAVVRLAGSVALGGVCDSPRFEAQIRETVLQFPSVRRAAITLNGRPLEAYLSLRGGRADGGRNLSPVRASSWVGEARPAEGSRLEAYRARGLREPGDTA